MRTLTALMLTAALAVPAFAQPGGGRGMGMFGGGGGAMLLGIEDVQKELKLTDEQKTKYKEFQTKQQEAMRAMRPQPGEQPDFEKIREAGKKMQEESAKFMKDTLTEDQNKRLKQLGLQSSLKQNPATAFFAPTFQDMMFGLGDPTETGKALKMTDEQKDKIKAIAEQMNKDLAELRPERGQRPTADQTKKMDAVRKEAGEKVMETLTADQRKQLKELTGDEFKGSLTPNFGGQGRRPGGGGGAGGAGGGAGGGNGQGRGRRGGGGGGGDAQPPKKDGDKKDGDKKDGN